MFLLERITRTFQSHAWIAHESPLRGLQALRKSFPPRTHVVCRDHGLKGETLKVCRRIRFPRTSQIVLNLSCGVRVEGDCPAGDSLARAERSVRPVGEAEEVFAV